MKRFDRSDSGSKGAWLHRSKDFSNEFSHLKSNPDPSPCRSSGATPKVPSGSKRSLATWHGACTIDAVGKQTSEGAGRGLRRPSFDRVQNRTTTVRGRTTLLTREELAGETAYPKLAAETAAPNDAGIALRAKSPQTESGLESSGSAPFLRRFSVETQILKCVWRPEPESNRRARICSPLRNHSAIGPGREKPPLWRACRSGQVGTGRRLVQGCRMAPPEPPNGAPLSINGGWRGPQLPIRAA